MPKILATQFTPIISPFHPWHVMGLPPPPLPTPSSARFCDTRISSIRMSAACNKFLVSLSEILPAFLWLLILWLSHLFIKIRLSSKFCLWSIWSLAEDKTLNLCAGNPIIITFITICALFLLEFVKKANCMVFTKNHNGSWKVLMYCYGGDRAVTWHHLVWNTKMFIFAVHNPYYCN